MRDSIARALARSRASYTEIRVERTWRTQVLYQGKDLDNLETSSDVGGIVRCLVDGGWGIAVFNSLDEMAARVEDAERIARIVSERTTDRARLAPVEPIQDEVRVTLQKDPREVPLQQKQALTQEYNELILKSSDKIVTTMTRYTDSFTEFTLANSEGTFITEERPDLELLFIATAREGEQNIQTVFTGHGRAAGFEAAEGQHEKAEEAARRAVELLHAKPVTGGVYTVILDPELAGVFIHEAFGHLCEADFLAKNPRLREILSPGRPVGVPGLGVVDDGYVPGLSGNYRYDDEGVPRRKVHIVRDGVLQGFLHNRETAARMGGQPTGNARAVSYRFEPIVRMRNTYIDRGTVPFEQMLREVGNGIYACSAIGGNTMIEQFTFSATYAYEIVDGQIGEMLRDVVLSGNIFDCLKNITMIGDDLQIISNGGGCGKDTQFPLMMTVGGPHVCMRDVTIGGRAG